VSSGRPVDLDGDDFAVQFGALFDEQSPGLLRYLTARVGPTVADDLLSEVFVSAIRYRSTFDGSRGTPRVWLYGIASNLLHRHRQEQARHLARAGRMVAMTEREIADHDGADSRIDAAAAVRALLPALATLTDEDRDVLLLNAWAGLEPNQIAQVLDLPAGTVRSKLSRIRRSLRTAAAQLSVDNPTAPVPTDVRSDR
jgi:RNA polymerase sigma factor (sigma-70 family)